jgi:hypothetical protein
VRTSQVYGYFFSLDSTHTFCFFNRLLDCIHRRIRINDHAFAKSARLSLSNPNDIEQTSFAGFARYTGDPAGSDIKADCVRRALGH